MFVKVQAEGPAHTLKRHQQEALDPAVVTRIEELWLENSVARMWGSKWPTQQRVSRINVGFGIQSQIPNPQKSWD